MSQNPFKGPKFQRLFQEWNNKLKEAGFIDAEDFSLPEPTLKDWHGSNWRNKPAEKAEDLKSYYDNATELLFNGFNFKSDLWKRTWELHCQGLSVRQIEKALWSQMMGYRGTTKSPIHAIIIKIQKTSGLKNG